MCRKVGYICCVSMIVGGIPFPFVPPSGFFNNALYTLSAPLTMRAFGIFMFRSKKHLHHNGNFGRCPLCRSDGYICCVSMIVGGIPFPFVPPSGFFNNALYTLSAPLTMRAFGIFMFRSKKHLHHNGNFGRCPLCRSDGYICCVSMIVGGIPFSFVPASSVFYITLCTACLLH